MIPIFKIKHASFFLFPPFFLRVPFLQMEKLMFTEAGSAWFSGLVTCSTAGTADAGRRGKYPSRIRPEPEPEPEPVP